MAFSFKLDPRLAGGTYGGERWVSPPTFTGAAAQDTVEARVEGTGPKGQPVKISPRWTSSNPEMVTVSPEEGSSVKITVKRAGESSLRVTAQGLYRELAIKGTVRNSVMQVEIRQVEGKKPAATPAPQISPPSKGPTADPPAAKSKQAGEAFLAENKTKEGVVALESGLQYKILKAGDGKIPAPGSTVVCQYRRFLPDGTEVDNSYKRKKPVTIRLKRAIKGWREALLLMPVGSIWQLFIPPSLGFGQRGSPRTGIGPNATLVFEVELVAIKEPGTAGNETTSASAAPPAREN
jgi:FKBP-type peptidyl-prolyl cis-trans isomerase